MSERTLVEAAVRAARAGAEVAPRVVAHPGTVTSVDYTLNVVRVDMHSDDGEPVPAEPLGRSAFVPGDLVTVIFVPPGAAYCLAAQSEAPKQLPLTSPWANGAPTSRGGSYWRDGAGLVRLAGVVIRGQTGSVPANVAGPDLIGVLPPGYRPALSETFATMSSDGGVHLVARVVVQSNGNVELHYGGVNWLSLSGVAFVPAG